MNPTSFLHRVASSVWADHSGNLEEVLVLTPNRRTMLFFKKALAEVAGRPVWAPECYTLDGWIKMQVQLTVPDELVLVMHLHRCWTTLGHGDSFERFYSLGQQIIRDFNAIDEAMGDTKRIFRDLSAIPSLDEEWLQEVEPDLAELSRRIQKSDSSYRIGDVWQHLGELYAIYNSRLMESKLAYPGMLYRYFAEMDAVMDQKSYSAAYAVGFYKLNGADQKILHRIPKLELISPAFSDELHRELQWEMPIWKQTKGWKQSAIVRESGDKDIEIFSVSGRQQQLQGLAALLQGKSAEERSSTMVLLPEQAILLPLLQVIPAEVESLNVSMGLSVLDTRVYTLVQSYLGVLEAWTSSGGYLQAQALHHFLKQPLLQAVMDIDPVLAKTISNALYLEKRSIWPLLPMQWQRLLEPVNQIEVLERCMELLRVVNEHAEDELDKAAIYPLYVRLLKLDQVMHHESEHDWSPSFFSRFLRRILQHTRITLSGEPLKGLQVLGLPESANLSFEHLIVLDANEGTLPMVRHQSLLPFTLLRAYGIPGLTEQTEVQEHLFWAACSSAFKVSIFYSTESVNGTSSEPSRWVQRLLMQLHPQQWKVHPRSIKMKADNIQSKLIRIPTDESVRAQIRHWLENKPISASALNVWLTCRLRWYLHHVLNFRERPGLQEDPEADKVGTIVHAAMQKLLEPYRTKQLDYNALQMIRKDISAAVEEAYLEVIKIPNYRYTQAPHQLYGAAIEAMVGHMLEFDAVQSGAVIDLFEGKFNQEYTMQDMKITLNGILDRMDQIGGVVRIVDYKTGKFSESKSHSPNAGKIWDRDGKNNKEALQVHFYSLLYHLKYPERPLPEMHLFFSRQVKNKEKTRVVFKGDESEHELLRGFEAGLRAQLEEMLSEELVIDQTENTSNCTYCPYVSMCGRY
jgi:hypothetical protein